MYKVKINRERNTLFLQLKGFLKTEEARKAINDILMASSDLRRGFIIINDISSFKPASAEVADLLSICKKKLSEHGASKSIRVIGNSMMADMQFNRILKKAEVRYKVVTVKSLDEAKRIVNLEASKTKA